MTQLEELAAAVAERAATVQAGLAAGLAAGLPSDRHGRDRLCAELHELVERAARLQVLLASVDGPVVRTWRFVEGASP
jgi:hypothetical protein